MRVRLAVGLCFAILMGLVLTLSAQEKKGDKAAPVSKVSNVQGKVGKIEKDTIVVMVGTTPRPVSFSASTKFVVGHSNDNKPGKLADVKSGFFIACSGTVDNKAQFQATECLYRDKQ